MSKMMDKAKNKKKSNKNLTEIVMILDRSGSMARLEEETIGGYNSFIEEQKKEDSEANLTTILFDNEYEVLHDRVNLKDVEPLTDRDYYARGMTALLDAIGKTIQEISRKISDSEGKNTPDKVIFVITTDGYENASREFSNKQIKEMVEKKKNENNWEFLFFGANIDSFGVGHSMGINHTYDYDATSDGIKKRDMVMCERVSAYRKTDDY